MGGLILWLLRLSLAPISTPAGLGLCDLLAEIVMCASPAAPPGGADPEAPVAVGAGILKVVGALLAVCLDEALDELVDVARLG